MNDKFEVVSCTAVGHDHRTLIAVTKDGRVFRGFANGNGGDWNKIVWTRTTGIPLEAPNNG